MNPHPSEPATAAPPPPCALPAALPPEDFGSFYHATLTPLRRFVARVLGDKTEAQDIAQDAYVKTYQAMRARPVAQPKAYLFTTAQRLAIQYKVRRSSRMLPTEAGLMEQQTGATEDLVDEVISRERIQAFDAAILSLPPGCRQVLILQMKDRLSHAEIAQRLEISLSTVAHHLARALRLLHEITASDRGDGEQSPPA